ncbi:oxidoreductase [Thermoclostridium stercorarium subsp. stercorarium DSM 8532]|uniref:Oxidoreductase n=3 Tax=Thermoclostridium stercorarium TaxID=1510 RepID=L7VK05_THES1|nr:mannitol dehydrogenase family protein [Thermoclostridium stercorarium]AGC67052.1 oxidoreductase [Thermoclostridium stercorarium subsp. stercorarium DSM 8532]AGI38138.1 MtlD [Thermoclostridium stercorarium subsp. stercorarium DSM 8532]ANW97546.1 mannitol dehydrogenase [Thermoclostridium stercorarium subsp. thermolacticum DSM 2910]ANX00106.1 mannitol dehydrogenase [Thermoclostridium stercorarium subsp. leptospartum DSM 9219]
MILNSSGLKDMKPWLEAGFEMPRFDREMVRENTLKNPIWLHFGAGNIFRAFPAALQQKLLDEGKSDRGIIVCEGYDYEIIERAYKPYDNLSVLVVLKHDGNMDKKVIASVVEALTADTGDKNNWQTLKNIFSNPSLQMVSFTITEKGYSLKNAKGEYYPDVESDFKAGPESPKSFIAKLTALCYERYKSGKYPVALVSMDNCSHNGSRLYEAVSTFAKEWAKNKLVDEGFVDYIENPEKVSFPWSMIDKITPRPDMGVKEMLEKCGLESTELIITSKNTYTAPFVNAEEPQYLVIEDLFPNGRPPLEEAGVIFTDRETVDKVEKMKVCTCLNPLHTALAVYGCLLGYNTIHDEMKDEQLKALVEKVGYEEGLPVVINPGIINPKDFIKEVVEVRLPNPFMPDTPQRIATDTSQKLAIRFGETIKAYQKREDLNVKDLKYIPLVLAGWLRYLLAVDDEGKPFTLSPDPLMEHLRKVTEGIKLGDKGPFDEKLRPILSDTSIFGVNLFEAGLADKVLGYFEELVQGPGAVRATLKKYLQN